MTEPRPTQPRWTIREILAWTETFFAGKDLDSPRLDAELLLGHALGLDRVGLYTDHDRPLDEGERARYRALIAERASGVPVAYLIGCKEFYGIPLRVDRRVLVPRPETECLVDRALTIFPGDKEFLAVDVGTGSGAIACALAQQRPRARVLALEICVDAIAVAKQNLAGTPGRSLLVRSDLLDAIAPSTINLVAANPPYIADEDPQIHPHVAAHEPNRALFAGAEGLDLIKPLLVQALRVLKAGGTLLMEIGSEQGQTVRALAQAAGYVATEIHPDLAGHDRIFEGRKEP